LSTSQAKEAGVKDKQLVSVKVNSGRPLIFENVLIRSSDAQLNEFHVDTDEGNAAGLSNGDFVEIL
jgi:propanediol utilization protein